MSRKPQEGLPRPDEMPPVSPAICQSDRNPAPCDVPGHQPGETGKFSAFQSGVRALRRQYDACLKEGIFPEELQRRAALLRKQEEELLTASLPLARRFFLNRREPGVRKETLVAARTDGGVLAGEISPEQLAEAGLTPAEQAIAARLLETAPEEPVLPEAEGFSADRWPCTFYCAAGNADFLFLFGDDGTVLLFENNGGWQLRRDPVLKDLFVENAAVENSHAILVLDLDHSLLRISYDRLERAEQLQRVPLYTPGG